MMKKIINLTKIFSKEYFLNLSIVNKNKKNILFWLIIILNITLGFLTQKCVDFLGHVGQEKIFIEIFFLILNIIIIVQTITSSINIFYFSKDIEHVLPHPIKITELLISRFNTILIIIYITELSFCTIPLLIYGIMINNNILYFIWIILVLIIFPIFIIIIINLLMIILTHIFRFIKNKNKLQLTITIILFLIFTIFQMYCFKNILINNQKNNSENIVINNSQENKININLSKINKYFLIINPCVEILNESNNSHCIFNLIKIICIEGISFAIFIFIGTKLYRKDLLKNISKININKEIKNKKYQYKKTNKYKKYIMQEFKDLIKNPVFLFQCVFPTIMIAILIGILIILIFPILISMIKVETQLQEIIIEFNMKTTMIILGIMQLIFIFSNIALTTISRKGKNAIFIKYIPIDLYKQFLMLNIPQIIFNNFSIIIILIIMKYFIPTINILVLFILANLLNIINSLIMVIIDLSKPNLNWNNETMAIKGNINKFFQYILTIIIILFLIYLNKIFIGVNFNLSIILTIIIFAVIIFLVNIYVKKNIKKIFEKIY